MDRQAQLQAMNARIASLPAWQQDIIAHIVACLHEGRSVHPAWIEALSTPLEEAEAIDLEMLAEIDADTLEPDDFISDEEVRRRAGLR